MKGDKVLGTLFETTFIGIIGGFIGGVLLYITITLKAAEEARQMGAPGSASHMCAADSAALWLAIFSLPAGALFGLCLGGFFLWRKSVAQHRPLP